MREQHLESGFGTGELARNFEKVTASEGTGFRPKDLCILLGAP